MIIGIPKEIKDKEFRVGIVPAGVKALTSAGQRVVIEAGAGLGSGITDEEYRASGADLLPTAAAVYGEAEMIMKVKEPLPPEYPLLREGQIIYTYLHLAPLSELTQVLLDKKVVGIAYETIELADGALPLLTPMSQVAGRMAVQVGAHFLEKEQGGRGVLLGGVPGVAPGRVVILGSGTVATHAAQMALGLGAQVTMLGRNAKRLAELDLAFGGRLVTLISSQHAIEETLTTADVVVGGVLVTGGSAPKLIRRQMLGRMQPGAVIVDVAIDQGGCAETSHPTTHSAPVFTVDHIIHYCVANMPGAVPRTSTFALTNATLPYALKIAGQGAETAARQDPALMRGINVYKGVLTCREVAAAQGRTWQKLAF